MYQSFRMARIGILLPVFCSLFIVTAFAEGQVYKYVDREGLSHYVDDPLKIPEEYRKKEQQPHDLPGIIRETTRRGSPQEAAPPSLPSKAEVAEALEDIDLSRFSFTPEQTEVSDVREQPDKGAEKILSFLRTGQGKALLAFAAVIVLVQFVSLWVLLSRAQLPALGLIVPIYNFVLLSRLGGFSGWWILWGFVPFVGGMIWALTVHFGIAKSFGKSNSFALGAALLPFVFIPILAFSKPE